MRIERAYDNKNYEDNINNHENNNNKNNNNSKDGLEICEVDTKSNRSSNGQDLIIKKVPMKKEDRENQVNSGNKLQNDSEGDENDDLNNEAINQKTNENVTVNNNSKDTKIRNAKTLAEITQNTKDKNQNVPDERINIKKHTNEKGKKKRVSTGSHILFHLHCFACRICGRVLKSGDRYTIDHNNNIFCIDDCGFCDVFVKENEGYFEEDYELCSLKNEVQQERRSFVKNGWSFENDGSSENKAYYGCDYNDTTELVKNGSLQDSYNTNLYTDVTCNNKCHDSKSDYSDTFPPSKPFSKTSSDFKSSNTSINNENSDNKSHHTNQQTHKLKNAKNSQNNGKTTRVRTVLNEKQLHLLKTCYAANPRPDALMKDQLVEMTGLNSRVIRVWFQNKRCKDKKRTFLIKKIQQHNQEKVLFLFFQAICSS